MPLRNISPLPGSFMLMSIIGFIIVTVYILGGRFNNSDYALSMAVAFAVVFIVMFIASVLSITPTDTVAAPTAKVVRAPKASSKKKASKKKVASKKRKTTKRK